MESSSWKTLTEAGKVFPDIVASAPERALLAFDFDGTLARISPDPESVSLVAEAGEALDRLAPCLGRIAIISGRPVRALERLAQVSQRPGLARAVLLGQYGAERLDVETGRREELPIPPEIGQARSDLADLLTQWPGAHLEDKGRAIAAHTRRCPDPEGTLADLEGPVRDLAQRYGLTVEPGRLVWELRGAVVTKGDALRSLVREESPTAVLMAGDDLGDVAAFDALAALAKEGTATCALVSSSPETPGLAARADVLCEGPDGVAAWLQALADRVE